MPIKVCNCLSAIIDPIHGFFQNLIHSPEYFSKLKSEEIKNLSYRILNRYNEKNFTALQSKDFTKEQVVHLDKKHIKYWVKSKQVEDIVKYLNNEQLLYVVQTRSYFNDALFENLTFPQLAYLVKKSESFVTLENDLKSAIKKLSSQDWQKLWEAALASKVDQADQVSWMLLENASDNHYSDYIGSASASSLNRMIKIAEKKDFKACLAKIDDKMKGNFFAHFKQDKPNLKDHQAWVRFVLNYCDSKEIEDLYKDYQDLIHDFLSQVPDYEIKPFLEHLPPIVLIRILVYASKNSSDTIFLRNAETAASIHKKRNDNNLKEAFIRVNKDDELKLDDLLLILQHFPFQEFLLQDEIVQLLSEEDLETNPQLLPKENVKPEQLCYGIAAMEALKDGKRKNVLNNLRYIIKNYDQNVLIEKVFKNLASIKEKAFCAQLIHEFFGDNITPESLDLTDSQWIQIFDALEIKAGSAAFEQEAKGLFSWVVINIKDQNLLKGILKSIDAKKGYELLETGFMDAPENKKKEILSKSSVELAQLLVQKLCKEEKDEDIRNDIILAISENNLRNLLMSTNLPINFRQNLFTILLAKDHRVLNELFKYLNDTMTLIKGIDISSKDLLRMSKDLDEARKEQIFKIIKAEIDSVGFAKLTKVCKLLLPIVANDQFNSLIIQDYTELLPTMSVEQLKRLWQYNSINLQETTNFQLLVKMIADRNDLDQGQLYYSLFKSMDNLMDSVKTLGDPNLDDKTLRLFDIALLSNVKEKEIDQLPNRIKSLEDDKLRDYIFTSLKNNWGNGNVLAQLVLQKAQDNRTLMQIFPINELVKHTNSQDKVRDLLTPFIIFCLENLKRAKVSDQIDYAEKLNTLISQHFNSIGNKLYSWWHKRDFKQEIEKLRESD